MFPSKVVLKRVVQPGTYNLAPGCNDTSRRRLKMPPPNVRMVKNRMLDYIVYSTKHLYISMFLTIYQPPDLTTEPATWHFNTKQNHHLQWFPAYTHALRIIWQSCPQSVRDTTVLLDSQSLSECYMLEIVVEVLQNVLLFLADGVAILDPWELFQSQS
jgi:hypothetical protein